jgi:hypothetical protein
VIEFLAGAVTICQVLAGVFFLRFWRRTKDPLFRSFAVAFWLLALSQAVGTLVDLAAERRAVAYLPRVFGYLLILYAILRANLAAPREKHTGPGP